jgi:hypothetical protein
MLEPAARQVLEVAAPPDLEAVVGIERTRDESAVTAGRSTS